MSRRRRKPDTRTAWVDWSPAVAALFDEVSVLNAGAEPPGRVRVFYGLRHLTVVARFRRANGLTGTTKIRIARPEGAR